MCICAPSKRIRSGIAVQKQEMHHTHINEQITHTLWPDIKAIKPHLCLCVRASAPAPAEPAQGRCVAEISSVTSGLYPHPSRAGWGLGLGLGSVCGPERGSMTIVSARAGAAAATLLLLLLALISLPMGHRPAALPATALMRAACLAHHLSLARGHGRRRMPGNDPEMVHALFDRPERTQRGLAHGRIVLARHAPARAFMVILAARSNRGDAVRAGPPPRFPPTAGADALEGIAHRDPPGQRPASRAASIGATLAMAQASGWRDDRGPAAAVCLAVVAATTAVTPCGWG